MRKVQDDSGCVVDTGVAEVVLSYDFEVTKDRDKICIQKMLPDLIKIRDHSKSIMKVRESHVRHSQGCGGSH